MRLKMVGLRAVAAGATALSAYGFGLTAPNNGVYSSSSRSITNASPRFAHSSKFNLCGGSRWQALLRDGTVSRSTFLSMANGGEPDAPRRFGLTMEDAAGVSRVLNRALGRILSTGDMFGSVGGKSLSDDSSFGKDIASALDRGGQRQGGTEEEGGGVEEDEGGGKVDDAWVSGLEDAVGERNRPSWRRLGLKRRDVDTNLLLQAKTAASAAIVVDGPLSALGSYMTLPVSEYSLLDSSIIRRISETTFRFQIPLQDLVGLEFTPIMEVEVELLPDAKTVIFRSTRSTLYGKIDKPGGEANTDPWPGAESNKLEYFRVDFNARLSWADGDASKAPRQRGKGGFSGSFARRSRPAVSTSPSPSSVDATTTAAARNMGGVGSSTGAAAAGATVAGTTRFPGASMAVVAGEADDGSAEALVLDVEPATVFCETEVEVQVVLPPPYNALLPRRLVRALLGKVLSTIVGYVLPRFLELLANDFYSWQSGKHRARDMAGDTARTFLEAGGIGYPSGTDRGGIEMDLGDEDKEGGGLEQERGGDGEDAGTDRRRRWRRGWGGGAGGVPINWWG